MTITAKYEGTCRRCGGRIAVGQEIEWERGAGASHKACPERKAEEPTGICISRGQGYGGHEYQVGQVLRHPRNAEQILVVLTAGKTYYREDGMSFGVGDDSGYIYSATCREATAEEAAPLLAREQAARDRKQAQVRRTEIADLIRDNGERPVVPGIDGEELLGKRTIYGGGDWFVIADDGIWYCQGNGGDGDCWANTNIGTPGYAGDIGWLLRYGDTLEQVDSVRNLADELRQLAMLIGEE